MANDLGCRIDLGGRDVDHRPRFGVGEGAVAGEDVVTGEVAAVAGQEAAVFVYEAGVTWCLLDH